MKKYNESVKNLIRMTVFMALISAFCSTAFAKDKDNNPPGKKGGPGTNWENPAGPKGGPGASPDARLGEMSKEKREKHHKEWFEKHPEFKQKADTNQDGVIDDAEKTAAHELRKQKKQEWLEAHPDIKAKWDTNGDGIIDEQERKTGHELWKQKKQEWLEAHPEIKAKMDANQDGVIDKTERKAAHEAWKEAHPRHRDFDNNPPGMAGGPGTNWENPRGPKGGPGASPDRKRT